MPSKGSSGEEAAVRFLEEKGIKIVQKNFRTRRGEIDIIALDGDALVFIEVKSWNSYGIDSLEYALDNKKKQKIIETSKYFLSSYREYKYMTIRYDVVFISPMGITHLASAFTEGV